MLISENEAASEADSYSSHENLKQRNVSRKTMSGPPSKLRLITTGIVIAFSVFAGCTALDSHTLQGTPHVYAEVVNEVPSDVVVLERRNDSIQDIEPVQTAIAEVDSQNKYRKNISEAEYRRIKETMDALPTTTATRDRWGGKRGFYVEAEVGIIRVSIDTIEAG
ncbi:hypothetical protein [Halorussus sp. MSC15.2]|uniref:hypothetical protein n=1 Tax=Halorussus sp. MSC15.2 TaxID=2283638 RepID=UPI0013D8C0C6|nr:hypothetical protein [Halorussus sp. MSC15.2]NEU58894.1 hypothetical protein [Halorussus sp. MSC15.2]